LTTTAQAPAIITRPTFTLADRIKTQLETIRERRYIIIGRLSCVHYEGQRDLKGFSQARPRYFNRAQEKEISTNCPKMAPFSLEQLILWSSLTLDWLSHKNAPVLAISHDRQDLLFPFGLTPLPAIPDPRWMPKSANDIAPRIPQLLTGCPVVGDRVRDKITARDGRVYGILHPIVELSVVLGAGFQGGFGRIRGGVDRADGTHLALLLDDSNPDAVMGYFVGGKFQFGG
jgi:hypothetical protein